MFGHELYSQKQLYSEIVKIEFNLNRVAFKHKGPNGLKIYNGPNAKNDFMLRLLSTFDYGPFVDVLFFLGLLSDFIRSYRIYFGYTMLVNILCSEKYCAQKLYVHIAFGKIRSLIYQWSAQYCG